MRKLAPVLLMIVLLMTAESTFGEEKVKIGYLRLTISLPTFVAAEKGLFEQAGLKVELTPFESGTLIVSSLIAGRIDANCSSATTGYWFAEQRTPDRSGYQRHRPANCLGLNTCVVQLVNYLLKIRG